MQCLKRLKNEGTVFWSLVLKLCYLLQKCNATRRGLALSQHQYSHLAAEVKLTSNQQNQKSTVFLFSKAVWRKSSSQHCRQVKIRSFGENYNWKSCYFYKTPQMHCQVEFLKPRQKYFKLTSQILPQLSWIQTVHFISYFMNLPFFCVSMHAKLSLQQDFIGSEVCVHISPTEVLSNWH